jgi:surface polysaccharide O-acyltransferase-like enzyme
MPVRLKKFIGMLLLVLLVIVYAIVSTAVAVAQLADKSAVVHLTYFFVTGLLWILPAMLIIKWMEGKPRGKS